MKLFMIKFINFDLYPYSGKKDCYACDIEVRCPACGWHDVFGVAASKEQYEKALKVVKRNELTQSKTFAERREEKVRYYQSKQKP
jgi:hypothetical protein